MTVKNPPMGALEHPLLLQPPDARACESPKCPNCELLKEQLRKLTYCLAVAQRIAGAEI